MSLVPLRELSYDGLIRQHKCHYAHPWPGQHAAEIYEILATGEESIAEGLVADYNDKNERVMEIVQLTKEMEMLIVREQGFYGAAKVE